MRVISYGGGVQSTALLVLATQGRIGPVDAALFANVGDDSEHPATLDYVRDVAIPYGQAHGIPVHELRRVMRTGETRTLMEDLTRDSRTINIPVRMANGSPGNRNCTQTFKMKVVSRWLREHGATQDEPATVCIGISTDEIHRVNDRPASDRERKEFPLIDLGLDRAACQAVIAAAGLPVPGKSSCFFCPFKRSAEWAEMRRDEPELFEKSAQLEDLLNERRVTLGKDPVWLTRFNKPLREAIGEAQDMLPGFGGPDVDTCDEGYCWT